MILNNCHDQAEYDRTERLIRPILRGRDIKRYSYEWDNKYLIATFPACHYDIELYPAVKNYLLSNFGLERLEQTGKEYIIDGEKVKARKKTNNKWFETQDSISYWEDFEDAKIVWARLMRLAKSDIDAFPRFAAVPEGMMVIDSLCFFTGNDTKYLIDALNSEYAAYYFLQNVAILDNGGIQMRQQYVEEMPIPPKGNLSLEKSFDFTEEEILFIKTFVNDRKREILES